MKANQRRNEIINILCSEKDAISGTELANRLNVSRQVIVQDIALLRANNKNILSTTKGYMLYETNNEREKRVYLVQHTNEQIEDELNTFVDNGGRVLDVFVDHEIYGTINVDLIINNRLDVKNFVNMVAQEKTTTLMGLTKGVHYHTVEADSEESFNAIESALKQKGYLICES